MIRSLWQLYTKIYGEVFFMSKEMSQQQGVEQRGCTQGLEQLNRVR